MEIKRLFILVIMNIICIDIYSNDSYYYAFDKQISITLMSNKLALHNDDNLSNELIENTISKYQLVGEWKNNNLYIIENVKRTSQLFSFDTSEKISCLPVYLINDMEAVLFNEIILSPRVSEYDMTEIISQYNITLKKDGGIYQIYSVPVGMNPISIANMIYKTGNFKFAYPHFFVPAESFAYIPNDPYFPYQITCHNTGQVFNDNHSGTFDADIDAPEAWEITKGSPDIIVAVFDDGVTSNHPDLPNLRQVRLNGSNFGSGDPDDPSPVDNNNHGNACAGVIAATMDNNEGIAGIAPNCKIMPLRWDSTTTEEGFADGINFAVNNGARILSCSWGYKTSLSTFKPAIVTAIENAIESGVVVVFAAGNTATRNKLKKGFVTFPANADVEHLITVGASDRNDEIANYSPKSLQIDLVAPSHKAYSQNMKNETFEMWSLDVPGNIGYNPANDLRDSIPIGEILPNMGINHLSYTGRFGGTSHACPVVAGVAALVLSVNPYLLPSEVFSILTNTCDKIGNNSYENGKNDDFGNGRVNAYAAVLAAKTKYIQNHTYQSGSVVAETYPEIIAGYAVTDSQPYGNVILEAGSDVTFRATDRVVLMPGFHAKVGSKLHVKIEATSTNPIAHAPQRIAPKSSTTPKDNIESSVEVITSNSIEGIACETISSTSIYTISGQLLQTIAGGINNLSHLPSGMYILQHRMSDGSVRSEKIANNK